MSIMLYRHGHHRKCHHVGRYCSKTSLHAFFLKLKRHYSLLFRCVYTYWLQFRLAQARQRPSGRGILSILKTRLKTKSTLSQDPWTVQWHFFVDLKNLKLFIISPIVTCVNLLSISSILWSLFSDPLFTFSFLHPSLPQISCRATGTTWNLAA